jgi:hypothetical protein
MVPIALGLGFCIFGASDGLAASATLRWGPVGIAVGDGDVLGDGLDAGDADGEGVTDEVGDGVGESGGVGATTVSVSVHVYP